MIPYKRDFVTLYKGVINYLPRCTYNLLYYPSSIQNKNVKSKKSINILGVTFDNKLNWSEHISKVITKFKKSLFALRLLRKYFTLQEMRTLLDAYFY